MNSSFGEEASISESARLFMYNSDIDDEKDEETDESRKRKKSIENINAQKVEI